MHPGPPGSFRPPGRSRCCIQGPGSAPDPVHTFRLGSAMTTFSLCPCSIRPRTSTGYLYKGGPVLLQSPRYLPPCTVFSPGPDHLTLYEMSGMCFENVSSARRFQNGAAIQAVVICMQMCEGTSVRTVPRNFIRGRSSGTAQVYPHPPARHVRHTHHVFISSGIYKEETGTGTEFPPEWSG